MLQNSYGLLKRWFSAPSPVFTVSIHSKPPPTISNSSLVCTWPYPRRILGYRCSTLKRVSIICLNHCHPQHLNNTLPNAEKPLLNSNCIIIYTIAILNYFPIQIIKSTSKSDFSLGNEQTSYLPFSKKGDLDFRSNICLKPLCAFKMALYNG